MAALLPGMQYMLEQMESTVERMREAIRQAQEASKAGMWDAARDAVAAVLAADAPKKRGRPAGRGRQSSGIKNYWAQFTPAQRSAEMRRRMMKAAKNATLATRTKPATGDTQKFNGWLGLTKAERKQRIEAMQAGRAAARKQAVNGAAHHA